MIYILIAIIRIIYSMYNDYSDKMHEKQLVIKLQEQGMGLS